METTSSYLPERRGYRLGVLRQNSAGLSLLEDFDQLCDALEFALDNPPKYQRVDFD